MKIGAGQLGGVLRELGRYAGVLLYGDDSGLVRERALAVARAVLPSLDDPFLSAVLVREEHGRLAEEAQARSLVGGRRVVRVLDAGDAVAAAAGRLQNPGDGALVILEAGGLTTRSKLRQMAEKAAAWACVACYPEEGATLTAGIRRAAREAGHVLSDDAALFLTRGLSGDTGTRRSELEKLFLFAGSEAEIDLEMAVLCCASQAETSLDTLLAAVMAGDMPGAGRLLQQIGDEGVTGPGLIVALNGRLQRVLRVRLEVQAGRGADEAVRSLVPPVFFP